MSARKKGAKCIACFGAGKVTQSDKATFAGLRAPRFGFGLVRCNPCGGTGRAK